MKVCALILVSHSGSTIKESVREWGRRGGNSFVGVGVPVLGVKHVFTLNDTTTKDIYCGLTHITNK